MENEKEVCRRLRHKFSTSGWAVLIYFGIVNVSVLAVTVILTLLNLESGKAEEFKSAMLAAMESGLGYVVAIAVGTVLLFLWKKKDFCLWEICRKEKAMRPGAFFSLFAIFFGVQAVAQVVNGLMESFYNLFGKSMMESMEAVSGSEETFSMFLYVGVLAPLSEEILFRGAILRSLQPFGKKFAILGSAFLFAIFHGNLIQIPYAFLVGLVLGYVTVEYSVWWAILLHWLNNFVLVDMMNRLSAFLPTGVGALLVLLFIWGCAIAALVILVVKRQEIWQYRTEKKMHPWCVKSFFTSPGVLTLTGVMLGNLLMTLLFQIFL